MDLTDIPYPDGFFDAVYCSHVLEHIPDDQRAMKELCRVLSVSGWAILQVPLDLNREKTFEDDSIQPPDERERAFGQFDHVRVYGKDYITRLEEAGFKVMVEDFVCRFTENEVHRLGLDPTERIYFCTKQRPTSA